MRKHIRNCRKGRGTEGSLKSAPTEDDVEGTPGLQDVAVAEEGTVVGEGASGSQFMTMSPGV